MIDLLPLLFVWAVAMACGWEDEWRALFVAAERFGRVVWAGLRSVVEFVLDSWAGVR